MNKRIIYFVFVFSLSGRVFGQTPCTLNNTLTNPANPTPSFPNPPYGGSVRGYHSNIWDWKYNDVSCPTIIPPVNTNDPCNNFVWNDAGTEKSIGGNPYFSNIPYLDNLAKGASSDFYPQNGWELVKRGFGFVTPLGTSEIAGSPLAANTNGYGNPHASDPYNREGIPYFILYNKYRSLMRIWAYADPSQTAHQIVIQIAFTEPNVNIHTRNLSGLFNKYNTLLQPLSEGTNVGFVQATAAYPYNLSPSAQGGFFYGDFQLSYDPCTCIFESDLEISFQVINTSYITLQGRYSGVTNLSMSNIDNNNNLMYGMAPADKFLQSVTLDPSGNVTAGNLMYNKTQDFISNYRSDVDNYPQPAQWKQYVKTGLEVLGLALDIAVVLGGDPVPIIAAFAGQTGQGLDAAGKLVGFLSGQLNTDPPLQTFSGIGISQGEIALKGTATSTYNAQQTIRIGNPGSKDNDIKPEVIDLSTKQRPYTTYNEVLGDFALISPVRGKRYHTNSSSYTISKMSNAADNLGLYEMCNYNFLDEFAAFKLDIPHGFKYVFNPAMNLKEYKIEASLVFEYKYQDLSFIYNSPGYTWMDPLPQINAWGGTGFQRNQFYINTLKDLTPPSFSTPWRDLHTIEFVTPFLPLECISNITTSFSQSNMGDFGLAQSSDCLKCTNQTGNNCFLSINDPNLTPSDLLKGKVSVRFKIIYISNNKDKNGVNNAGVLILTYPINVQDIGEDITQSSDYLPAIPENLVVNSSYNGVNHDVKAWNNITIDGVIGTTTPVKFIAGNSINVIPGAILSPTIQLETGKDKIMNCGQPYGVVPHDDLIGYCNKTLALDDGSLYGANAPLMPIFANQTKERTPVNFLSSLSIIPNPSTNSINLLFNTLCETQGSLFVYDITGHLIKTVFNNRPLIKGDHNIGTDISDLAAGEYIVRLITTEGVQTAKLVKIGQ